MTNPTLAIAANREGLEVQPLPLHADPTDKAGPSPCRPFAAHRLGEQHPHWFGTSCVPLCCSHPAESSECASGFL